MEAVVILVALPMVMVVSKGPACAGSVIDMLSDNITRVVSGIGVEALADVKVKAFVAMIIEFEFATK